MPTKKDPVLRAVFRGAKWNVNQKTRQSKTVFLGCIKGVIHLPLYDIKELFLLMGWNVDLLEVIPPSMFKSKVVVFSSTMT